MEYNLNIIKESYNLAVLNILNCFLKHTDTELNILACMLDNNIEAIKTENREFIASKLDMNVLNLNNYIKRLKDKGSLTKDLSINPNVIMALQDKSLTFKFHVN